METDPDLILQQELEALAGNAFNASTDEWDDTTKREPISATITRWQHLFSLSPDEAVDRIQAHRNNLTRPRISDAHWNIVQAEKEAAGYDREAYEYELELQRRKAALPNSLPSSEGSEVTYLVELSGPLETAEKVRQAADMAELPEVVTGRSVEEMRPVELCCIDEMAKMALLRWAAEKGGGFEPTVLVDPRSLR